MRWRRKNEHMIRRFRFWNNLFREDIESVQTEYCAIGYFDGMETSIIEEPLSMIHRYESVDEVYAERMGGFNCVDLIGIRQGSDEEFWKKGAFPYIFITSLRLTDKNINIDEMISGLESRVKEKDDRIVLGYKSFDVSDLLLCLRTSSIQQGFMTIKEYHQILEKSGALYISFSTILIWQNLLDGLSNADSVSDVAVKGEVGSIVDETLTVSFRCNIKDWKKYAAFRGRLKDCLAAELSEYGVFGSADALILCKNVKSRELLKLYGRDGLLVHSNEEYKAALYNVQTDILPQDYLF